MNNKSLSIRVELKGDNLEQFNRIKKEGNFITNTDVIRHCIQTTAQESNFFIPDELTSMIKNFLNWRSVRTDYQLFTVNEFIREAIKLLSIEVKKNPHSLYNWDVRSSMLDEEIQIIHGIIEVQDNSKFDEFSLNELSVHLDYRNIEKLRDVIRNFEQQGLISSRETENGKIYHAHKE